MSKADTATRAPRGTKPVSQAFFAALEQIPEASRAAVAKAAQTMIRDEIKMRREKIKAAAAKEKARTPVAAKRAAKAAPVEAAPKATTKTAPKATPKAAAKQAPVKAARKPAARKTPAKPVAAQPEAEAEVATPAAKPRRSRKPVDVPTAA